MSWNDSMIKQAKKIIKMYPQKRSAIGPLLHLAQSKDGYISDDSIAVISELVGITEVQVKSVSTFYSMYKQEPTGKYLLSVCKSISCEINNSKEIIDVVKDFTGLNNNETDENDLFTFEAVECIGACGGAPAMQVNYETVEGLTGDNAVNLCKWLKEKQPDIVVADDMQQDFGGVKSFDWAIADNSGATSTAPGFQTLKTTKAKK